MIGAIVCQECRKKNDALESFMFPVDPLREQSDYSCSECATVVGGQVVFSMFRTLEETADSQMSFDIKVY